MPARSFTALPPCHLAALPSRGMSFGGSERSGRSGQGPRYRTGDEVAHNPSVIHRSSSRSPSCGRSRHRRDMRQRTVFEAVRAAVTRQPARAVHAMPTTGTCPPWVPPGPSHSPPPHRLQLQTGDVRPAHHSPSRPPPGPVRSGYRIGRAVGRSHRDWSGIRQGHIPQPESACEITGTPSDTCPPDRC